MAEKKPSFTIQDWSENDRPREKFITKGPESLSNSELLAILISSGNRDETAVDLSRRILVSVNNKLSALSKLSIHELKEFKGIGQAKAISISAALELSNRKRVEEALEYEQLNSSTVVNELMQPIIGDLAHEEFWILYLNNSNKLLQKQQISKGGITGTLVDVRLVLKTALQIGATALILTHNHPSGSLKPSQADKQITMKLREAASKLDLKVLDHLIITFNNYYSFADQGDL